jgi:F-type H+-transporting ATPase subunit b
MVVDGITLLATEAPHGTTFGTVSGWLHELFDLAGAEFWVLIAFLLFIALIVWKARGIIASGLDSRPERIRSELEEAQRLREEAQALLADYQRKQRDAVEEAEAMLRAAEDEAARLRERAEADLQAAIKRREQQALDRIAQAEANAQAQVRNLAVDIAVAATRKILTEQLDEAKTAELVDAAIKEIPGKLH